MSNGERRIKESDLPGNPSTPYNPPPKPSRPRETPPDRPPPKPPEKPPDKGKH